MTLSRCHWINSTIFSAFLGLCVSPITLANDSVQLSASAQDHSAIALSKGSIAARIKDGELSDNPLFLPTPEAATGRVYAKHLNAVLLAIADHLRRGNES